MKTIKTEVGTGRQDAMFTEVLEHKKRKLRVRIKRDSYDFQSHALIELFDGDKWNVLDSIHYSKMQTDDGVMYLRAKLDNTAFKKDRDALVALAEAIL